MADYYFKLLPANPEYVPTQEQIQKTVALHIL